MLYPAKRTRKTWKVAYSNGAVITVKQPDYTSAEARGKMLASSRVSIVSVQLVETKAQKKANQEFAIAAYKQMVVCKV